jgi:hypothetical protein
MAHKLFVLLYKFGIPNNLSSYNIMYNIFNGTPSFVDNTDVSLKHNYNPRNSFCCRVMNGEDDCATVLSTVCLGDWV